jgi:hypothetical protein
VTLDVQVFLPESVLHIEFFGERGKVIDGIME